MNSESLKYSPFPDLSSLAEQKEVERQSIGVALLIVADDPGSDNGRGPLIWTIIELQAKEATDRTIGQVSIPAETRKNGESEEDNIRGALAEFCSDELLSNHPDVSIAQGFMYRDALMLNGRYKADLLVVVYEGPLDVSISPANSEEVAANGWMNTEDIAAMSNIRPILRQAIELERSTRIATASLRDYRYGSGSRANLLPPGFSIEDFYKRREKIADISMVPAVA